MLIGISGTVGSGKTEVARYLTFQGFQVIGLGAAAEKGTKSPDPTMDPQLFGAVDDLVDHATRHWRRHFVVVNVAGELLAALQKRPFFLHIAVDAPMALRHQRFQAKHPDMPLEQFVALNDASLFSPATPLAEVNQQAHVHIINTASSVKDLFIKLSELNLLDGSRLRPTWDSYFMRLADLAALRSNCMKRRVGCVIVRANRVIATGYNGTPRHLTNCNEGGCSRCNEGLGSGAALSTCLCLHAEENALLESGRDRLTGGTNEHSVLYCNTCPCLTCSIKIVQSGIKEVVYAQSYSMDSETHRIMNEANIVLRQYSPPSDGIFV